MESTYLNQVKKRLQLCCQESGLTLAKIHQSCKEEISYPSLRNLINGDALPTNLSHVKTICDAVGADLSMVLKADETAIPEGGLSVLACAGKGIRDCGTGNQKVPVSVSESEGIASGEENKSQTIYHCYLIAEDSAGEIRHGILRFETLSGQAASFQLDGMTEIYKGIRIPEDQNTIHLLLQDSQKRVIVISFLPACNHAAGCKGILIKTDAYTGAPVALNILLYAEDLLQADEQSSGSAASEDAALRQRMKGSLKMIRQYAYLPSDSLEKLKEQDAETAVFLEEYGFLLKDMGHLFRLKPDLMLSALDERDSEGRKKAVQAILKLQNISVNEDILVYGDKQAVL